MLAPLDDDVHRRRYFPERTLPHNLHFFIFFEVTNGQHFTKISPKFARPQCSRPTRPRRVWRAPRRHRRATRNEHDRVGKEEGNLVRAERARAHQRRLHGVPKLPCAARRRPGRGVRLRARSRTPPPERRAGDLTHAMVQLDESAAGVARERVAALRVPARAGRAGSSVCAHLLTASPFSCNSSSTRS